MHENAPLTIHEIEESWVWHYTSPSTTTFPQPFWHEVINCGPCRPEPWNLHLWWMDGFVFGVANWATPWHTLNMSIRKSLVYHIAARLFPLMKLITTDVPPFIFARLLPPLCLPAGSIEREHGENSPVFLESRGWLRHYSVSRVNKPEPISTRILWSSSALEIIECQISISEDVEIQILLTYT